MRGWRRALCGGFMLALLVSVAAPAAADYGSDPIGPTWVPDGPVLAVETSGNRVYVGGAFTGGVAALDASTGERIWTGDVNGDVRALELSSDGTHLLAGGLFTRVGGARHANLASLRVGDGAAEPSWTASAAGRVRDIVVDGDVAYFGGTFTQHDGLAQRGLGAVRVSTGAAVAEFDATTDGNVYALATNGARLFVGGSYTQVDGQPRDSLSSVTLASNTLDAWAPIRPCTGCNVQWDVVVNGGLVYVSGRNAGAITAFDATSAARRWRVTANGDAQALTLAPDGKLYVGGHFTEIADPRQPRTILAALNPATGALDPDFHPRFVTTYPGIWALAASSTRLYAGGYFTAAGASPPKQHPYLAMFGGLAANTAPTARATAAPSPAIIGQQITFSADGSDDAETPDNLTYTWNFGDGGTTADATGEVVQHAYPQTGRYTATVTVTDPQGSRDTASVVVNVNDPPNTPPTAAATATPSPAIIGQQITFSADGSDDPETPDNLTYTWNFGDGGTTADATGEVVQHAYPQTGRYTATVTVTDPEGSRDTASVVVNVNDPPNTPPTARATADPAETMLGREITFSASGSSDVEDPTGLDYSWDLGDGGTTSDATGPVVRHTYPQPGRYTATVTVTDPDGATDEATSTVTVNPVTHCASPEVDLGSGWREVQNDHALAGTYCATNAGRPGHWMTFAFEGGWVRVVHGDALRGGTARVFIDGVRQPNLSFRGDRRRIQFLHQRSYRDLGTGRHVVRIRLMRKKAFVEGFVHP